ncbi:MAG: winged helix-turn-helix domain-containing protein [Candidatus Altiarchaeales archaeon]|nr:winged helix-turn-helix domain-containing protein [Candidatus Altiarchaeota archaeon]MBU4406302.1 winged helix-turn-helix domain-containing protein [Candidatus Altiarchaeota archaeon]MBU4437056.1 winged helix-turn-helix domain-containing protein [Candidatus Altiarchaeota archaeon]MCG2782970.1 winged helix-turn-helix domain-containing protein [Candidatus Altiarchaeales archaeon]
MQDKITLDRETFKALAMDTRVKILKKLDENYQYTLTDLAGEMDMAPSTIKEHLDKLLEVELIKQVERGKKWKYYRLTDKGKKILNPYEKRVMIVLAASMLFLFGVVYRLIYMMGGLIRPVAVQAPSVLAGTAEKAMTTAPAEDMKYADMALSSGRNAVEEATSTIIETTSTIPAEFPVMEIPYAELVLALVLTLIAGICIGYLVRRRIS